MMRDFLWLWAFLLGGVALALAFGFGMHYLFTGRL